MKRLLLVTVATILCSSVIVCAQFNTIIQIKIHRKAVPKTMQSATSEQLPPCSPHQRRDSLTFAPSQTQAEQTNRHTALVSSLCHISVTSPSGYRRDPFTKRKVLYNELDLKASYEPTYTMTYGETIEVGKDKRSGLHVTFCHGDFIVSYCHFSQTLVIKGTHVRPGIIITLIGNSGRSTGLHLHLTLKDIKKGRAIDLSTLLNLIKHPL